MSITITIFTVIKLFASMFWIGVGGVFIYLSYIGLMVGEGQKILTASLFILSISLTVYGVYFIASYQP